MFGHTGKIVELLPANHSTAVVDVAGVRRRVDLGLLENDPPVIGDWVLIHVGFAMSKISERDAIEQMNTLAILGEAEAAMQEVRGYGLDDPNIDGRTDDPPSQLMPLQPPQPGVLPKFEQS